MKLLSSTVLIALYLAAVVAVAVAEKKETEAKRSVRRHQHRRASTVKKKEEEMEEFGWRPNAFLHVDEVISSTPLSTKEELKEDADAAFEELDLTRLLQSSMSMDTQQTGIAVPKAYRDLQLGEVEFDVSTSNEYALAWFHYGLLQLMCFGYQYATPAFLQARTEDPEFALAYAFQALTNFEPLWFHDDLATANAILDEMRRTKNLAMDDRESLYIDAITAHFDASVEDIEKRQATSIKDLDLVHEKYPEDSTALAYMALWRLELASYQQGEANEKTTKEAENYLNASLTLDPTNPAAVHFTLHAYDNINTTIAQQGLPAALLYPKIAPGSSHGPHMPMHILYRFGNWSDAWDADVTALNAADHTCQLYNMGDDPSCDSVNLYHSLAYLQIEGYNTGQWEAASAASDRMTQNYTNALSKGLITHGDPYNIYKYYLRMQAREILLGQAIAGQLFAMDPKTANITCPPPIEPLEKGSWGSTTESGYQLARGLCQVFATDLTVDGNQKDFDETMNRIAEIPGEYGEPGDYYAYLQNLMHAQMLQGAYLFVQNKMDEFHDVFVNATETDDSLHEYWNFGSFTLWYGSAHDLYGQLLLLTDDSDKKSRAMDHFVLAAAAHGPNLSTFLGMARSSENETAALGFYADVADMLYPTNDGLALPFYNDLVLTP